MPVTLGFRDISPPVFLAPLAGITDLPFRRLVARFGGFAPARQVPKRRFDAAQLYGHAASAAVIATAAIDVREIASGIYLVGFYLLYQVFYQRYIFRTKR